METIITLPILLLILASALLFIMIPGFALVETGLTRAKNAANVMMKNLSNLSIGLLIFGSIGQFIVFGATENSNTSIFEVVKIMFLSLASILVLSILSGALSERMKLSRYIIVTVFSSLLFAVVAHWTWGGGWLSKLHFLDYAGTSTIHLVGGTIALAGAIVLGPRLGKYSKNGRAMAIPGHNIVFATMGVFVLWLGWMGLNVGLTYINDNSVSILPILINTNISAAVAVVITLIITRFRYGKVDLSLTLNGALAGLVAISAGSHLYTPIISALIGLLAGCLVVFSVEVFDRILKVDDPVGAISVHGVVGIFGTLLLGLFSKDGGLFYGGGFTLLIAQLIGVVAIVGITFISTLILFLILKKTIGIRVTEQAEREGLDVHEHGQCAYNY